MKMKANLIRTLLLAASLVGTGTLLAQDMAAAATSNPTTATAGTSAATANKPGAKAADAPAKIEGIVLNRPNGGYLGLTLADHHFVLKFFDAKKKPAKVDVKLANARWIVHYSIYNEHAVLLPNDDGTALTSPKYVRPPYAFKLYLTLVPDDPDAKTEDYVIDFHT